MGKYRVYESVGSRRERVRSYDDLEIHHPSWRGREPGRSYANVDGDREEVLRQRTAGGNPLVSKDFVLLDAATESRRVPVPSPTTGTIGRVDPRSGVVTILDRPGGELIAQIRHMDLRKSTLRAGDPIEYGDPLGVQSGFGKGRPDEYATHVHIDFNAAHLDRFKRYIADLDSGALQIPTLSQTSQGATTGHVERATERSATQPVTRDDNPQAVRQTQSMLRDLGYRAPSGAQLMVDGRLGPDTSTALRDFAVDVGLAPNTESDTLRSALRETHRAHHLPRDRSTKVIEAGDSGERIEQLQRSLNRLGSAELLAEDGSFGPRTRQAIEAFQRTHGLTVDGRVGPETAAALESAQRALPSHASHPANARFREALDAVHSMEQRECRPSGAHSERLAAAVALASLDQGLTRIDRVELNTGGSFARGIEVSPLRDEPTLNRATVPISTADAVRLPLADTGRRLEEATQPRVSEPAPVQEPAALERERSLAR